MKINLLGMSLDAMEKFFVSLGEKSYRARQVFQWIHQKGISNFNEMSNLSKDLKSILEEKTEIKPPEIVYEKDSPLWEANNCYITPHDSAHSLMSLPRSFNLFLENVANLKDGKPIKNLFEL